MYLSIFDKDYAHATSLRVVMHVSRNGNEHSAKVLLSSSNLLVELEVIN